MLTWVVQAERGRQGLVPCLPRADVDRRHGLRDQGQAASPGRASSRAGWAGSSHALCSGDERGRRPEHDTVSGSFRLGGDPGLPVPTVCICLAADASSTLTVRSLRAWTPRRSLSSKTHVELRTRSKFQTRMVFLSAGSPTLPAGRGLSGKPPRPHTRASPPYLTDTLTRSSTSRYKAERIY